MKLKPKTKIAALNIRVPSSSPLFVEGERAKGMEKHIAQAQMYPSNVPAMLGRHRGRAEQSPCPTDPPVGFSELPIIGLNEINWSFFLIYF